MNRISEQLRIGTLGELLVQLRLLQFNVQAAAPLKDSGNDLIALRGREIRTIQIKTTTGKAFDLRGLDEKLFDLVAMVELVGENRTLLLDASRIFLVPEEVITKGSYKIDELDDYLLGEELVDRYFARGRAAGAE